MNFSDDSPSPCKKKGSKSKNFLKINTKANRRKNRYNELTFVEPHVDTFYIGLNEDIHGAYNPIHAKPIDVDEANGLVKNWVHMFERSVI